MGKILEFTITPVPKPRMTQRDVWKKRPVVLRYYGFKDECRALGVTLPDASCVHFVIPYPASWSQKKKDSMLMARHRQKPDLDNLVKSLMDAVHVEDSHLSEIHAIKVWGPVGKIIITPING